MYKKISLTQGFIAIVDESDYEYLMQWRWHVRQNPKKKTCYAVGTSIKKKGLTTTGEKIHMHREILALHGIFTKITDHINGNGLDNRLSNLRAATCSQNNANKKVRKDSKSGLKGVSFFPRDNKWRAKISLGQGKNAKTLGYFNTAKEATAAYNTAALERYGEFAVLNPV